MATTIGNLAVILSANAAGFATGMAAAQKSANSFIGTMGSMAKSAGAIVGIASAASLVGKAFKGFTDSEEGLLTFQALLGSASKAKASKEELKDFGDMTSFGDGVSAAAQTLLKFNFAQEDVLPTLKKLGDVAAGVNVPLEELAAVVGKSGYRASITGKQLIALTEMGVPIMQELTQTMKVSQDSITQMAEKGAIKFEHLMAAFDSASGKGGNFFGMMEARANTTKNLMSRIVDQTGDVIGKLGAVLGNRISAMFGVKSFGSALFDWLQRVEEGVKNMGPWFDNVILVFRAAGDVVESVWAGVTKTFQFGWDVISGALSSIGLTVGGFKDMFVEAMTAVRFVFQNFGDVMASILGRVGLKIFGFGADFAHIFTDNIPEALAFLRDNWKSIWNNIAEYTLNILAKMQNWGAKFFDDFKLGLATLAESVGILKDQNIARAQFDANVAREKARGVVGDPVFQAIPRPQFSGRVIGDAEKGFAANLDAIDKRLGEEKVKILGGLAAKQGSPVTDFILDLIGSGKRSKFEGGEMGSVAKAGETRYAGAFSAGSKEAYNVLVRSRDQSAPATQTATNTKETVVQVKKVVKGLDEVVKGLVSWSGLGQASLDFAGG